MPRHHDNAGLHDLLVSLQGQAERLNRSNRRRIAQVHAASLQRPLASSRQGGPDKQKTPARPGTEVFTDAPTGLESARGRYAESA